MTELSIMLISGALGEGATVTVTAHANQQQLDYKVTGIQQGNGKRRASQASGLAGNLGVEAEDDEDYEVMEY